MSSFLNTFTITIISTSIFSFSVSAQKSTLKQRFDSIVSHKKADIGITVTDVDRNKTIDLNGNKHYPMQSVYKFHLALAVLHEVDKGKFKLNQKIFVKKSDLLPNTHSPLRDKYPDGNVALPLSDLLKFTVAQSDNNGCDLLFRLLGGTSKVEQYIKQLGIKDISIVATEEEMHNAYRVQFNNWTTPNATNLLLTKFLKGKILKKEQGAFLMKVMEETNTGTNKIKGLLPAGTLVAHKTGYSGINKEGITSATNDIGIVTLPNGNKMLISIFVSMSKEKEQVNDKIMAELARSAWDEIGKSRN